MKTFSKIIGTSSGYAGILFLIAACGTADSPKLLQNSPVQRPKQVAIIVIDTSRFETISTPESLFPGDSIREASGAGIENNANFSLSSTGAEGVYVEIINGEAVLRGWVDSLTQRKDIAAKAQKSFSQFRIVDRLEIRRS